MKRAKRSRDVGRENIPGGKGMRHLRSAAWQGADAQAVVANTLPIRVRAR